MAEEDKELVGKNESSSSSEKAMKKILVHTTNIEDGGFVYGEFYTIDLSNEEIKEFAYVLTGGDQGLNSMVSIGSTVYVVGGFERVLGEEADKKPPNSNTDNKKGSHYHHGMSFIDLNSPDPGWKSAPCYRDTPTHRTAAVSLDGKIYAFARSDCAGIFDPDSETWETLLPPPEAGCLFHVRSRTDIIADPDNHRLFFYFDEPISSYFAYYPAHNRWERNVNISSLPWSSNPILVADHCGLFFIYLPKHPDVFKVYDSVAQLWLNVVFTEPFSMWRYKFQSMVYLGNALICLLAKFPCHDADRNYLNIVTVCKFTFVRSPTHESALLLTPFPVQNYPLNHSCNCRTVDFLPIPI